MNNLEITLVDAITIFIAFLAIWFTIRSNHIQANSTKFQTMSTFSDEIIELEISGIRNSEYDHFGYKYLLQLDKIAYLSERKIIDNKITDYFKDSFEHGKALMCQNSFFSLYFEQVHSKKELDLLKQKFANLRKFIIKHKIVAKEEPLPHISAFDSLISKFNHNHHNNEKLQNLFALDYDQIYHKFENNRCDHVWDEDRLIL